ncbi:hypothetical protein HYC85_011954 [Camellia sinensis]|uniref:SGNH hydrolase-type esterase domain-containing protein n=1 Tax=Camellia sinensis TaxID=4442 RepID=A0A7J7HCJ1_CAMSI|nr:hypothetical protein HYC85_011954 [Camellia sinensis]
MSLPGDGGEDCFLRSFVLPASELSSFFIDTDDTYDVPYIITALMYTKLGTEGRKDLFDWLSRQLSGLSNFPDAVNLNYLGYYKEYQNKLRAYLGEQKANETLTKALYVMSLGTNDFLENYYTLPKRRSHYNIDQYQVLLIGIAKKFFKSLYGLGARKISLGGLPPMGCLPLERTTNVKGGNECVQSYNVVAMNFNDKLRDLAEEVNKEMPGVRMVFANPYPILMEIVQKPSLYVFYEKVISYKLIL